MTCTGRSSSAADPMGSSRPTCRGRRVGRRAPGGAGQGRRRRRAATPGCATASCTIRSARSTPSRRSRRRSSASASSGRAGLVHAPAVAGTPSLTAVGAAAPHRRGDRRQARRPRPVTAAPGWSCAAAGRASATRSSARCSPRPARQERPGCAREGPGGGGALLREDDASPARSVATGTSRGDGAKMSSPERRPRRHPHGRARLGVMGRILTMVGQHPGYPRAHGWRRDAGRGHGTPLRGPRRHGHGSAPASWRSPCTTVGLAVRTEHGDLVEAPRAVIADVRRPRCTAGSSPGTTSPDPCGARCAVRGGTPGPSRSTGPSTGPSPGATAPTRRPAPCTSWSPSTRSALAGAQISARTVPERPFVLMGQMAAADPTSPPRARSRRGLHARAAEGPLDAGSDGITGRE